jgi:hypothetical protein
MPPARSPPRTRETADAPIVDWLALDDDTWRAVGAHFKGLDVFAMRCACAAFRKRIFPLADVPAGAQLALRLALAMKRLDHYPTPVGVTPHNLLAYKYNSHGMHKGLFPPRSNAGQTVDALLKAPLGELCAAIHALRDATSRLKLPFRQWLNTSPVRLVLKNRSIALKSVRIMEHCVGSLRRQLAHDEFCAGVRLFYDLDLIQQTPTYVDLCPLWWALAFNGYRELLQWIWDKQEDDKFDGYTTIRRRQSLLTWRDPIGHNVLQAAEKGLETQLRVFDVAIGPDSDNADPVAHAAGVEQANLQYKPIIAWVRQLRQCHLMPFQQRDDCPYQPEDMWMDEDSESD